MKRRDFVKCMGHGMVANTLLGAFGLNNVSAQVLNSFLSSAIEKQRILVLIYLQGGNDGLNTVIPLDVLPILKGLRSNIALEDKDMLQLPDTPLAFHPSLDGFKSLYDEKRLAVVQNVGYPEQNFSHFRSTDIWSSGSSSGKVEHTGWAGRYLEDRFVGYPEAFPNDDFQDPLAIEFGKNSSLLFQGENSSMSLTINDPESFYDLLDEVAIPVPDSPAGNKLEYVRLIAKQSQQYGTVIKDAALKSGERSGFPNTSLGEQLSIVSRLIAGGLQTPIYKVKMGSFDTHSNQVETDRTKGTHATLLQELNDAVMAFMNDLEKINRADDVIGMTYSEFGRRIVSNGSMGTDHGASAPLFVFGNKVKGGVIGENPHLDAQMDFKSNLEMKIDFRQVYASILEQWFEIDSVRINDMMFQEMETLPIISDSVEDVISSTKDFNTTQNLKVFPNPMLDIVNIDFWSNGALFTIDLVNSQGKKVSSLFRGDNKTGKFRIQWDTNKIPKGRYFVIMQQKDNHQSFSVVK